MTNHPPANAIPRGAHYAVVENDPIGSIRDTREDHWETTEITAEQARENAVAACEDLAVQHGKQFVIYAISPEGSWTLQHRYPPSPRSA